MLSFCFFFINFICKYKKKTGDKVIQGIVIEITSLNGLNSANYFISMSNDYEKRYEVSVFCFTTGFSKVGQICPSGIISCKDCRHD